MVHQPTNPSRDLFDRFQAIHGALQDPMQMGDTEVWLRFAALAVVLRSGQPQAIGAAVLATAEQLAVHAPWFSALNSPMRFVIAAMLLQSGGEAATFCHEVQRTAATLKEAGLRSRSGYDVIAAVIIHVMNRGRPLGALHAERIVAIHHQMKRYHWWLTGPDDLPACALMSFHHETAEAMVAEAEIAYRTLERDAQLAGERLQSATCLLVFTGLPGALAAKRFEAIASALAPLGIALFPENYEPIALLTLLDHAPDAIARRCLDYHGWLVALDSPLDGRSSFAVAADLAYLDLVRTSVTGSSMTDLDAAGRMLTSIHVYHAIAAILAYDAAQDSMPIGSIPMDTVWSY